MDMARQGGFVRADDSTVSAEGQFNDAQLEDAICAAQSCCAGWLAKGIAARAGVLRAAAAILLDRMDAFAETLTLESGRPTVRSRAEVVLCARVIAYYGENAALLEQGGIPSDDRDAREFHQGNAGILLGLEPWNSPHYPLTRFTCPNLLRGSVVLALCAQWAPRCASEYAQLWVEAGAPSGAFTNLPISPAQVMRVIEDPRILGVALVDGRRQPESKPGRPEPRQYRAAAQAKVSGRLGENTIQRTICSDQPGLFGPLIS